MTNMKTTLHKTPQGFVLTSDEEIKEGDLYWCSQKGRGIDVGYGQPPQALVISKKTIGRFTCKHCKKILAQQPQLDFSDLKSEEQKRIGWFDIEKLWEEATKSVSFGERSKNDHLNNYKAGFQKCQELIGQMFTLNDMIDFVKYHEEYKNNASIEDNFHTWKIKPKSYEVEIEMEFDQHNTQMGGGYNFDKAIFKPKLTEEGKIKILKIIL